MKKLITLTLSAVLAVAALPSVSLAEEEYLTRHVYDGWDPVYDTTKEKYHTYETEHFQIFWGDSGESGKVNSSFLQNCERVLENCWDKFVVEMGMTQPTTSNLRDGDRTTQYKVNVILNETGVEGYGGWAFGGVDREGYPYFMCAPDAMNDWVVPHEMGHVMHFAQGRNAWEGNGYLGPWYEAIGNWFREQYIYDENCYPEGANYRTDLSALYLRASSLMAVNGRAYYEAWPLLQYLTDNPDGLPDYGDNFIAKLLGYHPDASDGFYNVLAANTENSVQDTIGLFASHMAFMDFSHKKNYNEKIDEMLKNGWMYRQQRYTGAVPYGDVSAAYTVPVQRTPQSYGYNIIPLSGTGEVSVTLKGLTDIPGAGWRARLVAGKKDGAVHYSRLFGSGETGSINVASGEELYLTVTATKLGLGGWSGFSEGQYPYENKTQYPYCFTLSNALPESRSINVPETLRHPNGGGMVAPTAKVEETAYVGPDAMVLGWAQVGGNAVIDGNAIVAGGANVSGSAYIGGDAIVMDTATVTDNARVLENALVCGNYTVSGSATVKGQAILLGSGTAAGQAIAYGDLFEDEGKIIEAGAFAGYHCLDVNVNPGYFNQSGENRYARACADRLQAAYEFNGNFRDTVAYSDMYGVNGPALRDGTALFDGTGYLVVPGSALSYRNAELTLRLKYESGPVFDFGGLCLESIDGKPVLTADGSRISLDKPYAGGWNDVSVKFLDGSVTLTVNGESKTVDSSPLYSFGAKNENRLGKGFIGEIDSFRVYLYDGGDSGSTGDLPSDVEVVFQAGGDRKSLGAMTSDNNSVWCGWQADAETVTAGESLDLPAGYGVKVSSPVYGTEKFAVEFTPSGDSVYPDHAVIDGAGKVIFAHRFANDAKFIYPGRGEQYFCGSDNVDDYAGQKRLGSFIAEAVYPGSAISERGAAAYGGGGTIRITVENTFWSQELNAFCSRAVNKSKNLDAVQTGDPVYSVTYSVVNGSMTLPVSSSYYMGRAEGFGGISSFGTWKDKTVSYGGLRVYADSVPSRMVPAEGGVAVTNIEGGSVVFAVYAERAAAERSPRQRLFLSP